MAKALFVAILEDNSTYVGGSLQNSKWLELPKDKKIKRLFYTLPDGNYLCLELYEKYFQMIEATADMTGQNSGKVNIEYAYIFGEKNDKIICYKINLKQRPDKNIGSIERTEYAKNDPVVMGLSKDGWR